ncbi:MAG TPA: transketolase [Fimbriimonadaceae bacterium]|nr:transketolase [Fimbriimonadaceae bacterium]
MITAAPTEIDTLCINTIRGLSIDGVQQANSGHPGLPLGAAVMAYTLWTKHLRFNPKNPHWFNRDRFILSAGHGSMLLYSLLHLTGYDLSMEDLKHFRQLHSRTPGHPENHMTPGVEMATGPLGQGFAHSVGFAIAERYLAAAFNKLGHDLIDHYTYGICSDGDLMEGVTNEAASLAGHLKLGKLIFLYDSNRITIDGSTDITFTEDVGARFEALDWHVQHVDGFSITEVDDAIKAAQAVTDKPSLIICRTIIGFGSPNKAGKSSSHGSPLGPEEVNLTKKALGIPLEPKFLVPDGVYEEFHKPGERGAGLEAAWEEAFAAYGSAFPQEAKTLRNAIGGDLGSEWIAQMPILTEKMATRQAGNKILNALAPALPTLIGGSADLNESNLTDMKGLGDFQPATPGDRNVHFGIREHAMIAAVNGMTLHGGTRGFGASFLVFTDYCRPSLRLSALMECPSIFVFTHDSIGLGEDGPTHQPIEQIASLRAIPNFNVMRPCDGAETAACWKVALESKKTPCLMALTRQGLPPLAPAFTPDHPAQKGAYVLADSPDPKIVLIATGSEVQLAVGAKAELEKEGIGVRVVSMPSWFLFAQQPKSYQDDVLRRDLPSLSIEAGTTFGWDRYAKAHIGLDRFGLSGPGDQVMAEFGFTVPHVVEVAKGIVGRG